MLAHSKSVRLDQSCVNLPKLANKYPTLGICCISVG
jgi:hypothetical protein